uniref:Uncharacterized protein n=1 Tax=Arundo donax TaxID=35708 RepID=A0A0A9A068_ARUDO
MFVSPKCLFSSPSLRSSNTLSAPSATSSRRPSTCTPCSEFSRMGSFWFPSIKRSLMSSL